MTTDVTALQDLPEAEPIDGLAGEGLAGEGLAGTGIPTICTFISCIVTNT
jgi:hypothetical protein